MTYRKRRLIAVLCLALLISAAALVQVVRQPANQPHTVQSAHAQSPASEALAQLPVKGRAAKTGYSRSQFGEGWAVVGGCDTRNLVLRRDLTGIRLGEDSCTVLSGTLADPYTAKTIAFTRGAGTSDDVQIDHIVALSDAWQKGAQQLTSQQRTAFANDTLNLLAVDGPTNQQKSDGDAATWLPPNKPYRCPYIARQVAVKAKYSLWLTQAEHDIMAQTLGSCPGQQLPVVN